jgi:hypothetical protein
MNHPFLLIFHYGLPMLLAAGGIWGLFYSSRLDLKVWAWVFLQCSAGLFFLQLAVENPAPGPAAPNPLALALGVGAFLVALLSGFLMMGLAAFLKKQNGSWDEAEINRRLKP